MSTNVCYWNTNFVNIATGKAISFLWLQMKLHLHLHCETALLSRRKKRISPRNGQYPVSFCHRNLLAFLLQHKKTAIWCDVATRNENEKAS